MNVLKIFTRLMVVLFCTPGLIGIYSLLYYNYEYPERIFFLFVSIFNIVIGVLILFISEMFIKMGQEVIDEKF